MNLKLFYDFETTGIPLYNEPSNDPRQPHITQLAAKLIDVGTPDAPQCNVVASIDVIIKPEGWFIPDECVALNGITTELALDVGVPEREALQVFLGLWSAANERVGHNEGFDARIGRIAIKRLLNDDQLADVWKAGPAYCTQRNAVNHCKVPPTDAMLARNNRSWKTPSLAEAYQHFTGLVHTGVHRAMADTNATVAVYVGIRKAENPGGAVVDAEYREVGEAAHNA